MTNQLESRKNKGMKDPCRLCRRVSTLKRSHIIPKFASNWMKRTGGRYLRQAINPNKRMQDGLKEYLLCGGCEERFSKLETYFSNQIFYPYLAGDVKVLSYDERLIRFIISVLWRVLIVDLDNFSIRNPQHHLLLNLKSAEEEWRSFLTNGDRLARFNQIHLFLSNLANNTNLPAENFNRYLTRIIDRTIVTGENYCFIYAKFSRFLLFGNVLPFDESKWVNTKIENSEGCLLIPQEIKDGNIGQFLGNRARTVSTIAENALSDQQRAKIEKDFLAERDSLIGSDLHRVVAADFYAAASSLTQKKRKIGRNEQCPCGGGKKYKHCHGK